MHLSKDEKRLIKEFRKLSESRRDQLKECMYEFADWLCDELYDIWESFKNKINRLWYLILGED